MAKRSTLSKWLKDDLKSFICCWLMPLASRVRIWVSISLIVRAMVVRSSSHPTRMCCVGRPEMLTDSGNPSLCWQTYFKNQCIFLCICSYKTQFPVPPWCSWCVCYQTQVTPGLAGGLPPTCQYWVYKQQWHARFASAGSSGPPRCLLSPGNSALFPVRTVHATRSTRTSFDHKMGL